MAAWMGRFMRSWLAPDTKGLWGATLMPSMKDGQSRAANDGGSNFIIPDQSQNKDAAWAFVEFMLGRPDVQAQLFGATDIFPGLIDVYKDKIFDEADSYYAGQKVRQLYSEVAKQV